MCECVKGEGIIAGWKCCGCPVYNGMQRTSCRACARERCKPLSPDRITGEHFETYEEAYADDPETLAAVKAQLTAHARGEAT